jgi:heme-degrading monooxygenase HmoA
MLRRQPGFLGGLFLRKVSDQAALLTFWEDRGAVEALKSSPSYQKMTQEINDRKLLLEEPLIDAWEVQGGEFRVEVLMQVLTSLPPMSS